VNCILDVNKCLQLLYILFKAMIKLFIIGWTPNLWWYETD